MSAAGSDDTDHPATTEPPPPPVVTQRNDSLKRSSAEVSIMMMLRIPPTSPPPPPLSISSPPVSSSLPCPLCSPPPSVTLEHIEHPITSRSTPQTNPSTTSDLSAAATPKTATAMATSAATSISSLSESSSTSMATKMTMTMTMMSPSTSSARRSTASVQNWFQAELDILGIESVYSRYIISLLLQQDNYHCSADGDLPSSPDCTHSIGGGSEGTACSRHHQHHHHHHRQCATANNNNNNNNNNAGEQSRNTAAVENKNAAGQGNNKWGSGGGDGVGGAGNGRRQRSACRRDRQQPLSAEQRKKREAVCCLLEICDDILADDIEDLIEELMLRLKQVDNERSPTTQPVTSLPSAKNNNSTETYLRQNPVEQYYAAFPALSSESKVSVQIQNLSMNQLPEKTCNVWKKKQLLQQQQQQQQQSPKLAATLSTQTDNSVNLESAPTRGRQNNSASRRRRGNFSQTGNKENLHNHFTRGKDDHGSYNTSHNNRLRSGHCRTNRSVVSNNMPKFCQGSSRQSNSRSVGTRRHGEGGVGETCGVNVPPSSDIDFCFRTEPELKDVLRTTNKNSQAEKSVQEPHYACVSESNRNEGDGYEEDSQWYNVSFPIVSLASSNSNTGLRSDERSYVRLFHRHSNPPSSPRSAVSLDNIEKKEFPKVSSCLGPHTDKDFKKSLSSEGTDKMYAATKRVVDTSMRSILDCSPEEILPSSAQSPSEEVDCTVQLVNLTQSFVNKSMIASGTFGPAADGLNKSASLIKALSPGVASPTTPVSSSSSSLMDIAYITKLDDLDGKQIEAARNQSNAFRIEGLFSSFFDSSYQLVAEIKTSRRSNFAHDPCVMVSNSVTEGETQNPVVGPVGQNLYNATSYTFLQERLVSGVQRSDIVAQNEQLSQFWDLNFQRHVISNNQNSHNDIDDSPSARPLPHSADQVISQTVTPFSYFSPSVLNPSTTNVISTSITHNSASVTTTRVLPACVSSTEVTRNCETSFVNSKQISQQAGVMSTACSNMYQILDDSSSISLSSSPNVKLALTMTTTVLSSSYSVISSTSSGTSSSSSSPSFQEPPRMEPTQASALVPSTNSAFERVVPSERSIMDANQDEQRITPEDEEVMRQVNRVSSNETLYFSPRTHFRPIDSPPITTVEHSVLNNETITDTSLDLVVQSREPVSPLRHYQTLDLFGGYTGSCSPYQLFKPDSYKDNGEGICEGFIPSFKITKTHDKFVQTGNLEENVDVDLVKLAEELCAENVNPRSVLFLNNARCCSPSSVCTWRQPNRLQEFTGWRYSRNERCVHLNWNSDDPQWTPVSSTSSWSSALSSPTSTSLEHHRYSSTRDSCWHTGAEAMSSVRDDAWLSSSSGTPNSGLSTPFTTSTSSQTRIHVVCKTKATNEISVCTSSDVISEVENWRSNSSDWTVNSTTPFYLQANPRRCELEEGCREMVVDKAACKLVNSRTRNELLSPETHTQASSLQSMWPKKTCKPESYAHQDEVLSKGPKPSLSSANSFVQRGTKVSTEEEPVLENQDGSCSPRTISKIWANSNSIMWSMPQFTHSSSSSTSASLAASPASISSPPLSSLTLPPTSNDSLLDLVCGPACAQTAGASKPCQHQQLRKIWEHVDPTTTSSSSSSTGHGDVNETTKDSLHQLYGAKENQLLLMNNMQTRSSHELPSFGSARRLARVPIMPPGIKNQSSKYQKPQSKIMSLIPAPLVPLPSAAVYSSELEKEWLSGETSCSSSAASVQRAKIQREKSRSCKKPCSFFLEGNCWRQECKYAHDICTITCRFWEEGECFKGDTCPFLHGYSLESVRPFISSSSSFTRRAEASPSITATIHSSSMAHPSAPPEEFEKECRSLTQSKALLSDRISTGKAGGSILTSVATDVLSQGLADKTTTTTCSGSDTPSNTAVDSSCNRRGNWNVGVSSTTTSSTLSSSSPRSTS